MSHFEKEYLILVLKQFIHFKERAEKAILQLTVEELHWRPNEESNNIAIIIKHLSGNMQSRRSEFLTTDGEKASRDRDSEFLDDIYKKEDLMKAWEDGWKLLFQTIENLQPSDLHKEITIRTQPLSVLQAIQIEVAHISYYLGQIIYIGKQMKNKEWITLSIIVSRSGV
ncbi:MULTISPECIES: DUF1572 family protein [Bacillus]|uniref:DUF1572 family protein n=1 Tax=Bacillus TaxID=1386 RepID=UPI0002E3C75C|nr:MULTISPECIES: DUF1572 family protein [Bacillus]